MKSGRIKGPTLKTYLLRTKFSELPQKGVDDEAPELMFRRSNLPGCADQSQNEHVTNGGLTRLFLEQLTSDGGNTTQITLHYLQIAYTKGFFIKRKKTHRSQ